MLLDAIPEINPLQQRCRKFSVAFLVWGVLGLVIGVLSGIGGNTEGIVVAVVSAVLTASAIWAVKKTSARSMMALGCSAAAMGIAVIIQFISDTVTGDSWGVGGVLCVALIAAGTVYCFVLSLRLRGAS